MSTTTFISHWGMWAANSESAYGTSDRFHPAGWCLLRWQLNGDVIFPVLNKQMWIWPGENENIEILISNAFLFGIILSGIIYSNNIVLYLYALFTQVCCLLYSFLLFVKLCCLANCLESALNIYYDGEPAGVLTEHLVTLSYFLVLLYITFITNILQTFVLFVTIERLQTTNPHNSVDGVLTLSTHLL